MLAAHLLPLGVKRRSPNVLGPRSPFRSQTRRYPRCCTGIRCLHERVEGQVRALDDPDPKGDPDRPTQWTITAAFDLDEGLGAARKVLDLEAPFRPELADIRPYPPVSEQRPPVTQ